jgi:hypothetical protein
MKQLELLRSRARILLRLSVVMAVMVGTNASRANDVALVCRGILETNTDLATNTREFQTLNILLDIGGSRIRFQPSWGCSMAVADLSNTSCVEPNISITETEVSHRQIFNERYYRGNQSFTLNRNSGTLRTFSVTQALAGSGARWATISQMGSFECSKATRQF